MAKIERIHPLPFAKDGKVHVTMPDNTTLPVTDIIAGEMARMWGTAIVSAMHQRGQMLMELQESMAASRGERTV